MAKEINLVPDIKDEFIKTLKFRNLVFFLCIVVASGSLVVILVFLSIAGGQQSFITAKQNTLNALEQKINDYSDLSDFLTIKDQLGNISAITDNKTMMSRTFNILSALIPSAPDADYINVSELTVNLSGDAPTFTFDAQANAVTEPYIDYNVLDSFKKSMQFMRYDYGDYVDKNGDTIPAYCIIESDSDGATLKDASKGYYAYWLIAGEGCNPAYNEENEEDDSESAESAKNSENSENSSADSGTSTNTNPTLSELQPTQTELQNQEKEKAARTSGYTTEDYNGETVVRIWRTPQYSDWYKENPKENEAYMDLNGEIHNLPHFNSSCITYQGVESEDNKSITWTATNDTCLLVPGDDESEGINIQESSNGRSSDEELVLRFSAVITFAPEVYNFNNHHMLALSPSSRRNVTDSYSQIQSIFAERAADCEQDDAACITTPTSGTSSSTNNSSNSSNNNTEDN